MSGEINGRSYWVKSDDEEIAIWQTIDNYSDMKRWCIARKEYLGKPNCTIRSYIFSDNQCPYDLGYYWQYWDGYTYGGKWVVNSTDVQIECIKKGMLIWTPSNLDSVR